MTYRPTPEEKLKFFGKVDCAEASRLAGEPTHCPCWPQDDCCYCGMPKEPTQRDTP